MPSSQPQSWGPTPLASGPNTFSFAPITTSWQIAKVTIQRDITPAGGQPANLNGLAVDAADINVQVLYQLPGTTVWRGCGGAPGIRSGTFVTKGVTLTQEEIDIGIGSLFPVGTSFQVSAFVTGVPVTVGGTIVYSTP